MIFPAERYLKRSPHALTKLCTVVWRVLGGTKSRRGASRGQDGIPAFPDAIVFGY